jgi:hypothetical protein
MRFILLAASLLSLNAFAGTTLRYRQTVLEGALIRAGGAGGTHSLTDNIVNNLCEEGVSKIFYLYPDQNFSNAGVHRCAHGSVNYLGGAFRGPKIRAVLEAIQDAATGKTGPVVVHCWNGWHATGEISAYALMQFCDMSGDRAAQYWANNIGDKGNLGKYGSIVNRIRNFQPLPGLRVSDSVKARICP